MIKCSFGVAYIVFPYGRQNSRPFSHTRMFAHLSPRVSPRVHRQGGAKKEKTDWYAMAVFSLLFPDVRRIIAIKPLLGRLIPQIANSPFWLSVMAPPIPLHIHLSSHSYIVIRCRWGISPISDVHTCISGPSRGDLSGAALSGIFLGPFKTLTHLLGTHCPGVSSLPIFFYLG
ncbi:hypothetical protein BJV77DRAFT_683391 [Russula vinacea]|nr:hypothetical protein BJV77DRAFT_683391 [Russula vinacea]